MNVKEALEKKSSAVSLHSHKRVRRRRRRGQRKVIGEVLYRKMETEQNQENNTGAIERCDEAKRYDVVSVCVFE